ncbi:hypothetical protein AMTRI_Chr03g49790 [Amborella trichopoda]
MTGAAATNETVCVTGASGFVESWLIMRLLEHGYVVKATVRHPECWQNMFVNVTTNTRKTQHLLDLPGAKERLRLWKADLNDEGSFDEAIFRCTGNEVIIPTIKRVLDIMKSCLMAKTVRRVAYTSSAGTSCWSDVKFCRGDRDDGLGKPFPPHAHMYFVSKTLAEKAAWDFAKENNIDFISIIPTLVVGPFIMQSMPPSMITALALLTKMKLQIQFVRLDELCNGHIFLFECPDANGRYICSSHDTTIVELAKMLRERYTQILDTIFPKIGFKYQYTLEDMYDGAIKTCEEKGSIPLASEKKPVLEEKKPANEGKA